MKVGIVLFLGMLGLILSGCGGATALPKHYSQSPSEQMKEYGEVKSFVTFNKVSVKEFITSGNDVNTLDNNGNTLLQVAALSGDVETVSYLLDNGAKNIVKKEGSVLSGFPATGYAMQGPSSEVLALLVKKGYIPNKEELKDGLSTHESVIKSAQDMIEKYPELKKSYTSTLATHRKMLAYIKQLLDDSTRDERTEASFKTAQTENTLESYQSFLTEFPESRFVDDARKQISAIEEQQKQEEQANKVILDKIMAYLQQKDVEGLLDYANKNPDVMAFAHKQPKIYLLFTGPKELQVGKLLQYKKRGISEAVLVSKVKSLKKPYRKFSLDEIETMMNLGITDGLLVAMMDVTTEVETEKIRSDEQLKLVQAQKELIEKIDSQKTAYVQPAVQASPVGAASNVLVDKVTDKAIDALIDHLF